MFQDLRYGLRLLLKNFGFTTVVVLTLALGIGANAALFSVVNGVLLKPLPYPDPEQLITIHQSKPNFETGAMPYPNFLDLQKENKTLTAMAISRSYGFSLVGMGEAQRVSARLISADFFSVLGVKPALGRTFLAADDSSSAEPVTLISAQFWADKFGSASNVLEKSITLDDKSYRVVGVIPATYTLTRNVDVYVPIAQWNGPQLKSRSAALGLHGIGRIKPGVTVQQAQADLDRIMQALAVAYPATNQGNGAKVVPLMDRLVGDIRLILWMLLAAVGFVLLIACVNVSNLLLARSTSRTREYAIRTALGAGRWRLLRQSLLESTILALAGGTLGLFIAAWGTKLALTALPTALPRAEEIELDSRVVIFTIVVSILTGLLAGIVPALKTSYKQFSETLKEGGRGASATRGRAQGILVAVEMAMALVLLIGAGLMIRSLNALWNVDPGFRPDNVVTFDLTLPTSMRSQSEESVRASLRDISDKIATTPGVQGVSLSADALPMVAENDLFFWIEGQPKPASTSEMSMALVYTVEPDYLSVMGIPLKQGRFFTPQDDERSTSIAVIDEAFARRYFADKSPLGNRIYLGDDTKPIEIVGVIGHVKQWGLDSDDKQSLQAQLYFPFRALPDDDLPVRGVGVVVRSAGESGETTAIFGSIRKAIQSQNDLNVVSNVQTLNQVIADSLSQRRFSMLVLGAFAAVALLLASLGIYGVISYLVGQRTHELGIRLALGAGRKDILRLVLSHGMKMALAGVAIGLVAAFGLTRLMTTMLYGVRPTDPLTFVVIALILLVVALIATYVPARRATKVDPLTALRSE
ncbi:MAG TPA: ABC transporter permease [Pyrinomonadaceae bacterium]